MKLNVIGKTAQDERCFCRSCCHFFMTSEAVIAVQPTVVHDIREVPICCPVCASDDVQLAGPRPLPPQSQKRAG